MAEYRTTDTAGDRVHVERRSNTGMIIGGIVVAAVIIVAVLFLTGFWSAKVTQSGELPKVSVSGGQAPKVDLDSKKVVVGTETKTVKVPKVETEEKKISVPVVGTTDGKKD